MGPMSLMGGSLSGRAISIFIVSIFLLSPLTAQGGGPEEGEGTREQYYTRVQFDEGSTYVISGGISQWGSLNAGLIGRTSFIVTRLRNQMDIPFRDIKVNLTIYWYEGPKPDKGEIMYKDFRILDIEGGDGVLSDEVRFEWTPQFAGSYAINLSCHVPGDVLPITDTWTNGLGRYIVTSSTNFHHGWWVGTRSWNCSSLEGWNVSTSGGPADQGWHISRNPLALEDPDLHTTPDVLYVGNDTTGMAPTTGVYTLTSPPINLSSFNPDAYMHEWRKNRPQIYLLYKYRGNIHPSGPNGRGGLFHRVSIAGEDDFRVLKDNKYSDLDPQNHTVVLNGNTSELPGEPLWAEPSHPSYHGDTTIPGIELGEYVGKTIQIRIEYVPSGLPEPGFMIDDIIIIGKDRVDITPFEVDLEDGPTVYADPGETVEFRFNLTLKPALEKNNVRIEAIDSFGSIDIYRDIEISPSEFVAGGAEEKKEVVSIRVSVPMKAHTGEAWFKVRIIGGGASRDIRFPLWINDIHSTDISVEGFTGAVVAPGSDVTAFLNLENNGNVVERFDHTFVSEDGLLCINGRGRTTLEAGTGARVNCTISVPSGSMAGKKLGYLVISTSPLPSDEEVLSAIVLEETAPSWEVNVIDLMVEQVHLMDLAVPSSHRTMEDPPDNGSITQTFELFITNMGNGDELLNIGISGPKTASSIKIESPDQISVGPDTTRVMEIGLTIDFPFPEGRYVFLLNVNITQNPSADNWTKELIISIGDTPVPIGLYMVNGSISSDPEAPLLGEDCIISFSVRSFGLQSHSQFRAVVLLNGLEVSSRDLTTSSSAESKFQIPMIFDKVGINEVHIRIEGKNVSTYQDPYLGNWYGFKLNVTYVELTLLDISIGGKGYLGRSNTTLDPGLYSVELHVENRGNHPAWNVVLMILVKNIDTQEEVVMTSRADILPGETETVRFNNIRISPLQSYRIVASVDQDNEWIELDEADNDLSINFEVGQEEPQAPIWRKTSWVLVVFSVLILSLVGMFIYLIQRKL